MRYVSTCLAIALLGSSLLGCKKKDDANPTPTKTDLLVSKGWITKSAVAKLPNGTVVGDLYQLADDCEKDDITIFQTPNVLKLDQGANKCDASDPQQSTGSWAFNTDQTVLTITDPDGSKLTGTVKTLDVTTLVVETTQAQGGTTYTITLTYQHS